MLVYQFSSWIVHAVDFQYELLFIVLNIHGVTLWSEYSVVDSSSYDFCSIAPLFVLVFYSTDGNRHGE